MTQEANPITQSPFVADQLTQLEQRLDTGQMSQRQGGGGAKLDYLKGHVYIDNANRIFGFGKWGYELIGPVELVGIPNPEGGLIDGHYYAARIRLTVQGCVPIEEEGVCPVQEGRNPRARIDAHDMARKGAVTDAMKRALRCFGDQFGNSLYDPEEREELHKEQEQQKRQNAAAARPSQANHYEPIPLNRPAAPPQQQQQPPRRVQETGSTPPPPVPAATGGAARNTAHQSATGQPVAVADPKVQENHYRRRLEVFVNNMDAAEDFKLVLLEMNERVPMDSPARPALLGLVNQLKAQFARTKAAPAAAASSQQQNNQRQGEGGGPTRGGGVKAAVAVADDGGDEPELEDFFTDSSKNAPPF